VTLAQPLDSLGTSGHAAPNGPAYLSLAALVCREGVEGQELPDSAGLAEVVGMGEGQSAGGAIPSLAGILHPDDKVALCGPSLRVLFLHRRHLGSMGGLDVLSQPVMPGLAFDRVRPL
jgi:hypothetical protein